MLANAEHPRGVASKSVWDGIVDNFAPGLVKAKWYDVWAAAVAVDALSVGLRGRGGSRLTPGSRLAFSLRNISKVELEAERGNRITSVVGRYHCHAWRVEEWDDGAVEFV